MSVRRERTRKRKECVREGGEERETEKTIEISAKEWVRVKVDRGHASDEGGE